MNLDDTQKESIKAWISEGLSISEIQTKMTEELSLKMTYMEVRFLVDDLGVQIQDPEPEEPEDAKESDADSGANDEVPDFEDTLPEPDSGGPAGKVSVSMDSIARPGALVSGKVTFSDGQSAGWTLDQFGRLGLSPDTEGYKPSQEDAMAFQVELQNVLKKGGF